MFNSDYEIRMATLAALGGDTSITYDSVYSIDLEILRLTEQGGGGGGEGLTWNQIKSLLATNGVNEILVNSSNSSITLDYDLLSQIGQGGGGGGDYVCIDSVDALSGITSPKDGAIAYVAGKGMWKYYAATAITKWLAYDVDYDALTAEEINTMCADYYTYRKDVRIRRVYSEEYDNRHLWILTPGQFYGDGWLSFVSTICRTPGDKQIILKMIFRKLNGVWQCNSGETAILELYTKGKSENDIWNDTKNKLTNKGVDTIKFNSGSTSSITLDYNLVSQIGQGGGGGNQEYICVNTVDELSGITTTDGMLAYVGSYNVTEEKKVVVWDAYGEYSDSINFDYGDGNTCQLNIWNKGREVSLNGTGSFDGGGDYKNSDNEMPLGFTFNNGAKGTFVSFEHGDEWSTQEEWKITLWMEKHNGSYPTVTFNTDGATVVVTGATTENVSVHHKEKGFYKFYADVNKWIATEIYIDNYNNTDIQDVLDDYLDYRKPLTVWFMRDYNGKAYRKGFAGSTIPNEEAPKIRFTTPADDNESGWMIYSIKYQKESGTWSRTEQRELNIPQNDSINERIESKITTQSSQFGLNIGGLFSVGLDETMSGVTISTTINLDASATDENHIATITDINSNRGYWEQLCEDGWLNGVTTAATNAEWFVLDYNNFWDGDINSMVTPFAAVKVQDNGDSTFTITYFLSGNNWNGDNWETQYFRFEADSERGYTWTVTQNQTLTVTPHLYTMVRYTHKNNTNNSLMYKLV